MAIRSLVSNEKRETQNEQFEERQERAELRLCIGRGLPLQSVHLQELQLLGPVVAAPPAVAGGATVLELV